MTGLILRLLGHKAMHNTVAKHTTHGGVLDVQLGFALLRDRRVPIVSKLLALALGAGSIAAMMTLELPLESLIAVVLPLLGVMADFAVDGIEAVIGPIVVAALLIQHIAPAPVVQIIREERLTTLPPAGITG